MLIILNLFLEKQNAKILAVERSLNFQLKYVLPFKEMPSQVVKNELLNMVIK